MACRLRVRHDGYLGLDHREGEKANTGRGGVTLGNWIEGDLPKETRRLISQII